MGPPHDNNAQDLFKFRVADVLKYDLADVRLPGAVADPFTGEARLAKSIGSNPATHSTGHKTLDLAKLSSVRSKMASQQVEVAQQYDPFGLSASSGSDEDDGGHAQTSGT